MTNILSCNFNYFKSSKDVFLIEFVWTRVKREGTYFSTGRVKLEVTLLNL